jgi:hypothetical protein
MRRNVIKIEIRIQHRRVLLGQLHPQTLRF